MSLPLSWSELANQLIFLVILDVLDYPSIPLRPGIKSKHSPHQYVISVSKIISVCSPISYSLTDVQTWISVLVAVYGAGLLVASRKCPQYPTE